MSSTRGNLGLVYGAKSLGASGKMRLVQSHDVFFFLSSYHGTWLQEGNNPLDISQRGQEGGGGGLVEYFLFKHKVTMLSLFSDLWVTHTHTPIQTGIWNQQQKITPGLMEKQDQLQVLLPQPKSQVHQEERQAGERGHYWACQWQAGESGVLPTTIYCLNCRQDWLDHTIQPGAIPLPPPPPPY